MLYPNQGATKRAVATYYASHADALLAHVKDRPLSIVRCPRGRAGRCFYQKHHRQGIPESLDRIPVVEKSGRTEPYLVVRSAAGLVACAQLGALELHVWGSKTGQLERPERLVFDLDPDESLQFSAVKRAAVAIRDQLAALELKSFALLTGGKGIHVVVPLRRSREWPDARRFAKGLASNMTGSAPDRYVTNASKAKREGKIFIDWLRNERGATAIAPYSPRARSGAPVATPIGWYELPRIRSADQYSLENIDRRLSRLTSEPWEDYHPIRQSLTQEHMNFVV